MGARRCLIYGLTKGSGSAELAGLRRPVSVPWESLPSLFICRSPWHQGTETVAYY